MKINLKSQVLDIKGEPVMEGDKPVFVSEVIAARLFEQAPGIETLKSYDWAVKLYKEGELDLDTVDLNKLKTFIEQSQTWVLVKGLALKLINEAELANQQ